MIVDFTNVAPCLRECGEIAKFTGQRDPATLLAGVVIICFQDPTSGCGGTCAPN